MASDSFADSLLLHGVHPTGKEIGVGAHGKVFEVDYEGTLCAAKEINTLKYAQGDNLVKIKDDFLSECRIWSILRHPCVVQFLGVYYPAVDLYRLPVLVMEKMQHSLGALVEKYNNIPLNVKLSILDEVCLGLRYLHSRNPPIVHGDLTPNNILLSYRLEAKISDLGVAKVVKSDNQKTMTKLPGTPDFMPPEALSIKPVYEPSLDMFSYGGVILNVTTQLWPKPTKQREFNVDTDKMEVVPEVKRRQQYLDKMIGGAADLKPLVRSCLDNFPRDRPPVAEVSMTIKRIKDVCSEKIGRDGMMPIEWWAEVCNKKQPQVTSSLTTALEEMTINNEQLRRENDVLKDENTQLKANMDEQFDEIRQLKAKKKQLKQQLVLKESTAPEDLFINWEEGAPVPVGRGDHVAVWLNGLVYVGGGYEDEMKESYTINCYDPVKNSWSSPFNTPYCLFAMTELNNKLLIAGGVNKSSKVTNQILTMDDSEFKNYTKMTIARCGVTAAGHEGMLIITGGIDDKHSIISSTELFDSTNGQWYTCSDLPEPHYMLRSAIVDNILYLLGGYNEDGASSGEIFAAPLDDVSAHQLKWSTDLVPDIPCIRCTPLSVSGTRLVIIGGVMWVECTSNVHKLNKVSHTWETVGQIPLTRCSSAAVSTADNKVFVIGGYGSDKAECTNTVWIRSQ